MGEAAVKTTGGVSAAVWDVLCRLYHGPSPGRGYRDDWYGRKLVCTPYGGQYGRAGWVVCVNGSPPRGTLLLTEEGPTLHGHPGYLVFWDGARSHRIRPDTEAAKVLWHFWRKHLADADGPQTFYPPG